MPGSQSSHNCLCNKRSNSFTLSLLSLLSPLSSSPSLSCILPSHPLSCLQPWVLPTCGLIPHNWCHLVLSEPSLLSAYHLDGVVTPVAASLGSCLVPSNFWVPWPPACKLLRLRTLQRSLSCSHESGNYVREEGARPMRHLTFLISFFVYAPTLPRWNLPVSSLLSALSKFMVVWVSFYQAAKLSPFTGVGRGLFPVCSTACSVLSNLWVTTKDLWSHRRKTNPAQPRPQLLCPSSTHTLWRTQQRNLRRVVMVFRAADGKPLEA